MQKNITAIYFKDVMPVFPSRSCMVSSLRFRSLIHFQFIFAYGVRKCANFILSCVAVHVPVFKYTN